MVGKNGSGKSTILRLINSALLEKPCDELSLCERIDINFSNSNSTFALAEQNFNISLLKSHIDEFFSTKEFNDQISKVIKEIKVPKKLQEDFKKNITEQISKDINSKKKLPAYQFKKSDEEFCVEYISTINMSANSINKIQTSDGNTTTFLDYEIENEIQRLLFSKKNDLKNKFLSALNNMFNETNKTLFFEHDKLAIHLENKKVIPFRNLSSGERQIIYIFLKVINATINNSLILMDEPEISLHLSWQESLLSEIRKVNPTSQIIIVTHSPAIVMNGWMDKFVDIKEIIVE